MYRRGKRKKRNKEIKEKYTNSRFGLAKLEANLFKLKWSLQIH